MTPTTNRTNYRTPDVKLLILGCCLLFILAGCVFIPYAGIEDDEALFAGPFYGPVEPSTRIRAFQHDVPLMLMPYLGTLKTWIYWPIFKIWAPGLWSLRLPPLLFGAATIWLLSLLLMRISGPRGALTGCALLATDAVFLLTTTFDWGPVALQHLLILGGTLLAYLAWKERSHRKLACAFLLFGLVMWDKALASWMLGGLTVATLTVFPAEFKRMLTRRNLAAAGLGFAVGALPLIIYNIRNPWATFKGNTIFSTTGLSGKAAILRGTLEWRSLYAYMVNDEWVTPMKSPATPLERASVSIRDRIGPRRGSLQFWAFVGALALAPFWWRRWRSVVFVLVTLIIAWLAMALNLNTGGAAHHAILLWPFPQILIAVAVAEATVRWARYGRVALAVALVVLSLSNALVVNQHFVQFVRNGAAGVWNDASLKLQPELDKHEKSTVLIADWGMFECVRMMSQGRYVMFPANDAFMNETPNDGDFDILRRQLSTPSPIYVTHVPPYEVFGPIRSRLESMTRQLGYEKRVVRLVTDSNGRPVYEIARFEKTSAP